MTTTPNQAQDLREQQPAGDGVTVDAVLGLLPVNVAEWKDVPQGYMDGYNDALQICRDEVRHAFAAITAAGRGGEGEPVAWIHPGDLLRLRTSANLDRPQTDEARVVNFNPQRYVPLYDTLPPPARVDDAVVERAAAAIYGELTGEPWTVLGMEHPMEDRDHYRDMARAVLQAARPSEPSHE